MKRGMLLCVLVGAALAVLGVPGAALAGGGCHSGVTENDATGEKDATVRMIDACFTATVTTVDPGTPVTFANTEWTTHNVGGNQWGHFEDMIEGDAFTVTFDDAGIYPFACNYHPGMTGAIVVGDGKGAGGGDVSVEAFEPPAKSGAPVAPVAATPDGVSTAAVAGVGLIGLALGAGLAVGIARFGRTPPAA
jgi:plastocyanin